MTPTELELAEIVFEIIDFLDDAVRDQYNVGSQMNQWGKLDRLKKLTERAHNLVRDEN